MAKIDFPGSPTAGQQIVANGRTWKYNATKQRWDGEYVVVSPTPSSIAIDDLSDVDTTGIANGDVLIYNSTSGNLEPGAQTGGGSVADATVSVAGVVKGFQDDATGATYYGELSGQNIAATGVTHNTLVGYRNGPGLTAGSNAFFGSIIGRLATSATQNTAVGFTPLYQLTTGDRNSAFGANAGYNITTGSDNTFFGRSTGGNLSIGSYNTFVGNNTGSGDGNRNTVVGGQAFDSSTTASQNVIIGMSSATAISTGQNNTIIGYATGTTLTGGSNNVIIGENAEPSSVTVNGEMTLGSTNISSVRIPGIGFDTSAATDGQFLAWNATNGTLDWVAAPSGGGASAINDLTDVDTVTTTPTTGQALVWDGTNWIPGTVSGGGSAPAATPTALGTVYGIPGTSTNENTVIGLNAGGNLTGNNNVLLGYQAGQLSVGGNENVYIGRRAAAVNTGGVYNVMVGHLAGYNSTTASHNSVVGHNSGLALTTGVANSFFGNSSGTGIVTGSYNTSIGRESMSQGSCNDSAENTALGHGAGRELNGNRNTAIGHFSLPRLTTGGNDNIALGKDAGAWFVSGDRNMFIGKNAGYAVTSAFNQTVIGSESAGLDGASNVIVLGNSTQTRLILPGLGLDTNDAADGDCLIWNNSTGQFVWGDPTTGSTGNLEATNLTVTGEVTITSENAFKVNSATNKTFKIAGDDALAGVFTKAYHDHARFLSAYTSVTQEYVGSDFTTWTADSEVNTGIFAGKLSGYWKAADTSTGKYGTRWTFNGSNLSFSSINNVLLATRWSANGRKWDLLAETSSDGSTWTTVHESGLHTDAGNRRIFGLGYTGGNQWFRVTIVLTNDTAVNDFTQDLEVVVGSLQILSSRPGDQGRGPEYEFPYVWDGDRKIYFQNDIIMEQGSQILAEGNPNDGDNVPTAPAISFRSESNTGMYLESFNTLGFSTGGQKRMKVTSGGAFVTDDNGSTWEQLLRSSQLATAEIEMTRLRVSSNNGRVPGRTDAGVHGIQIGTDDNYHMEIDNNEIAVLGSDGNPHNLMFQREGGNLQMFSDTGSSNVLQFQPGRIQVGGYNVLTTNDGVISDTNRVLTGDFSISKTSGAAVLYMDSGSNDSARLYVDGGNMYIQAGSADNGRASGGGNIKLTGYNGTGLASATLNLTGVGDGHILTHTNYSNYNLDANTLNGKSSGDFVALSDVNTSDAPLVNFGRNIIKNAVISATPESDMTFIAGFHNDWAFARLRGATVSVSGTVATTPSNSAIDTWFDAKASTSTVTVGATEADATVIEITGLPKNLNYSSWVGLSFGAHWNRCKGIKIETYASNSGLWETQFYTNTNNSEMITTPATTGHSGYRGINGIRISLWDGQATSNTQCRLANIFGWDYNSDLGTKLYMDRSGGDVYGDVNVQGAIAAESLTVNGGTPVIQSMGTFTPTIAVGTVTTALGQWVKQGNLVTVNFEIRGFSDATSWSNLDITNMPFVGTNQSLTSFGSCNWAHIDLGTGGEYITCHMGQWNNTNLHFRICGDETSEGSLQHARINDANAANAFIRGTITYITNDNS